MSLPRKKFPACFLPRNICSEYGEYNIQCNGIGPGYIATPQTAPLREMHLDRMVTDRLGLSEINKAIQMMLDGTNICKIIIDPTK